MDISIIFYLVFMIAPLSIFIHELGHGTAARLCKANQVNVILGAGKQLGNWQFFHINFRINLFYFIGGYTSSDREKAYKRNELIFISLLGPVFNGIACLISLLLLSINPKIVHLFFLFNLWLAVGNLVPFTWQGKETDGYTILQLIRNQNHI